MLIKAKQLPKFVRAIVKVNEAKEAKKAKPKKHHRSNAYSARQFDGVAKIKFYCADKLTPKATVIEVESKEVTVIKCL